MGIISHGRTGTWFHGASLQNERAEVATHLTEPSDGGKRLDASRFRGDHKSGGT